MPLYKTRLEQVGAMVTNRIHTTRLKDRLLSVLPDLIAHSQGRDTLLLFEKNIGPALMKACDHVNLCSVHVNLANEIVGLVCQAGRSSEVERSLMARWVVGSILHGVNPLSYVSFQPVLHDWCNKGRGMCHPLCGIVHIKEPLLLIDKSSISGGSGFPFSLSEWSLTICLTPYNRR